ncbi:MAG: transposase, partial [Atopobium sp.]|nr:transposase [Atopobium sp.]MCC6107467.1 transposase [Atopobium sp.]
AGLSSFRGLEQKEYDSSDGDASLPMVHRVISNFKAYVEGAFHSLSKKHLQSYADSYSWRYSHRSSSDACMELLHEMCLMHVPLSGIAATATVQPKLPASLPKPFAVQGA